MRQFPARTWAIAGALALAACAGCSRPPAATARAAAGGEEPRETLARLMTLRAQQQYGEIPALILAPHGDGVVAFLRGVDDFLTANRRLCDWLRDHAGVGLAQIIDQSYVADDLAVYAGDDLGVFSRNAELLDQATLGGLATVTYTVENRLPAKTVRLRNIDGQWRYDPGGACPAELPAAFHDMARALESLLAELENGQLGKVPLHENPELLMEKVKARLRHGVGLLSKAQAARSAGVK